MPRVAKSHNVKKLAWAEQNLANTERRIRRLTTAKRNWERRVKYYTNLARQEVAQELATKMLAEQAKAAEEKFDTLMGEGRRFRND